MQDGKGDALNPEHNQLTFLKRLVEESPDALIALSPQGRVLYWSRGAEAIFGFTDAEAVGQNLDELVVPPEGRAEAREQLRLAFEQGSALFEAVRQRKDGSRLFVDVSKRRVERWYGRG